MRAPALPLSMTSFSAVATFARTAGIAGIAAMACSSIACAGLEETPKTPPRNIGEPSPTAVTSATPLWLSNAPSDAPPPSAPAKAGKPAEVAR